MFELLESRRGTLIRLVGERQVLRSRQPLPVKNTGQPTDLYPPVGVTWDHRTLSQERACGRTAGSRVIRGLTER